MKIIEGWGGELMKGFSISAPVARGRPSRMGVD